MRTCFRVTEILLALLLAAAAGVAGAQTLARPGWAGSGMAQQPWWHNAVLYSVDPRRFQDSDGDGRGDLRGLAQRMDYVQSLGVDAVVLDPVGDGQGFDDLIAAASPRRIRILVTLEDAASTDEAKLLAQARSWLTRGAAGLLLHSTRSAADAAPLLQQLRALTDRFPGTRVLLAATATNPAPSSIHAISIEETATQNAARARRPATRGPAAAQMTEVPLELTNATARTIRAALIGVNNAPGGQVYFLSERMDAALDKLTPEDAASAANLEGRRKAFALVLLASRGAASVDAGQEIGQMPVPNGPDAPLMQWTPRNLAPVAKPVEATPEVKPSEVRPSDEYGTFRPYVPAPKKAPTPAKPTEAGETVPPVDPDSLPGFTSGDLPRPAPADAATMNVAREDALPDSLLNMYRRLIQLHHDSPTLRDGTELLLDYDDLGAVVWVRTPPAGSMTSSTIVAVCNLSGAPLKLSLDEELQKQRIHTGSLRNLLSTQASQYSVQSTGDLTLPPYGVFLGELYH